MQRIDRLMGEAEGIDFRIDRLDERFGRMFPGADAAGARDRRQGAEARARLDRAMTGSGTA
jgi:conjugal transfer/entry exclusion protein